MKARRFQHAPKHVIGYRNDGRPIFPIAGGAKDDPPKGDPPADPPKGDPPADPPKGMDAEAWKAQARKNEDARNAALKERDDAIARETALKQSLAKAAGLDPDSDDGQTVDLDKAIDARLSAERKRSDARLIRAEIKAAAVGKLTDPTDALTFLALDSFEVSEDGAVDESAITSAIESLVKNKPYLAAQGQGSKGSGDGGPRKESGPSQLTASDLDRMSAEEIREAQDKGLLKNVLTGS